MDEEISIGDYVLTGGEIPALVLVDCISRLIPGVLGGKNSASEESFSLNGLLEYPQYTRPEEFMGMRVPEVLLSGHHKNVELWRRKQSLIRIAGKRPDTELPSARGCRGRGSRVYSRPSQGNPPRPFNRVTPKPK